MGGRGKSFPSQHFWGPTALILCVITVPTSNFQLGVTLQNNLHLSSSERKTGDLDDQTARKVFKLSEHCSPRIFTAPALLVWELYCREVQVHSLLKLDPGTKTSFWPHGYKQKSSRLTCLAEIQNGTAFLPSDYRFGKFKRGSVQVKAITQAWSLLPTITRFHWNYEGTLNLTIGWP